MNVQTNQMAEIDTLRILKSIWRVRFLIVFIGLMLGTMGYVYTKFTSIPMYSSTTKIYVLNKTSETDSNNTSSLNALNGNLNVVNQLMTDYVEIIKSREVIDTVASEFSNFSSGMLAVSSVEGTHIITITVSNTDAVMAQTLATRVREVATEKIKAVSYLTDVTILEEAPLPKYGSVANPIKRFLLGFLVGAFLVMAIVVLKEILDNRVRNDEDVENNLGMVLLGSVPKIK